MAVLGLPSDDLRRFPRRTLRADVDLHRIHRSLAGPWWFSGDGSGRFDLPAPEGTLYCALSPLGAFVEVFRDFTIVAEQDLAARSLSGLRVGEDLRLADMTSPRTRQFGVTAAVHTTTDYTVTQAWAAALREARFAGVRYLCGHDPSQSEVGIALFGEAGGHDRPVAATGPVGDAVVQAVEARFGILVLPTP